MATLRSKVVAKDESTKTFSGSKAYAEVSCSMRAFSNTPHLYDLGIHFTGKVEMHEFENYLSFEFKNRLDGTVIASKIWKTENSGGLKIDEVINLKIMTETDYIVTLKAQVDCGDNPKAVSELDMDIEY